jgi:Flp pilus assembly protein TadB
MTDASGLLSRLRSRGEEMLTQLSAELGQNPRFVNAMAGAMRGKEKLEQAVARVLREMSVPTRGELTRALARIDALERELASLERRVSVGSRKARPGAPRAKKPAAAPRGAGPRRAAKGEAAG